jgi:hypothetical protein
MFVERPAYLGKNLLARAGALGELRRHQRGRGVPERAGPVRARASRERQGLAAAFSLLLGVAAAFATVVALVP